MVVCGGLLVPSKPTLTCCLDLSPAGLIRVVSPFDAVTQSHLIGQNSTATGQEPADPGALMAQRLTTILQDFVEIRCSNKGPVRWQRWQRLLAPVEPLLQ